MNSIKKSWEIFLEPEIKAFIQEHDKSDVKDLGLKKPPNPDWPFPLILDQIKSRQKAAIKLPLWASHHDDIIFPPSDIIEQASSAATARYKARLVQGQTFIDLTGGAGVDCCAFTEHFQSGHCIEQDENAAALIKHNMKLLSTVPVKIQATKAEEFVKNMPETDLVYIDPQRRSNNRKGLYRLEDGQPNVKNLIPFIKDKAQHLIIKTAPMLDITSVIETLDHVAGVHIVEWRGDCKEVLYVLNFSSNIDLKNIPITTAIIDDEGEILKSVSFTKSQEEQSAAQLNMPMRYLYEPGPALQKSGGFNVLSEQYALKKLHKHTHLYTSNKKLENFPGRVFEIIDVLAVKAATLKFKKANLSVRNFPEDVDALKKKLKLKDGGNDYLFACTLMDESKALLHCRKP